jgi:hypothetical protein
MIFYLLFFIALTTFAIARLQVNCPDARHGGNNGKGEKNPTRCFVFHIIFIIATGVKPPAPAGRYKPARSERSERRSNELAEASGRGYHQQELVVVHYWFRRIVVVTV